MAGAIEFVDEPDGGDADAKPTPRRGRPNPWLVALVVAVIAAGVAFALTRPSQTPHVTAHAPATSGQRSPDGAPDHPLATPSSSATGRCGGAPFCAVSLDVPAAVTAALHGRIRGLSGLRVETALAQSLTTGSTYLADRVIYLDNASVQLKIRVHRLIGPAPAPEDAALGVVRVRVLTDAFVVDALSYPTNHPGLSPRQLRALARDPRLELL